MLAALRSRSIAARAGRLTIDRATPRPFGWQRVLPAAAGRAIGRGAIGRVARSRFGSGPAGIGRGDRSGSGASAVDFLSSRALAGGDSSLPTIDGLASWLVEHLSSLLSVADDRASTERASHGWQPAAIAALAAADVGAATTAVGKQKPLADARYFAALVRSISNEWLILGGCERGCSCLAGLARRAFSRSAIAGKAR